MAAIVASSSRWQAAGEAAVGGVDWRSDRSYPFRTVLPSPLRLQARRQPHRQLPHPALVALAVADWVVVVVAVAARCSSRSTQPMAKSFLRLAPTGKHRSWSILARHEQRPPIRPASFSKIS